MKLLFGFAATVLFSSQVIAEQPVHLNGTTPQTISAQHSKVIRLLNIHLSAKDWKKLDARGSDKNSFHATFSNNTHFPRQVQLGMNDVPVMDQGPYGTCVTFANTAAIDAALNKGDYISQLCQLRLGQFFEHYSHKRVPSGWNGSMGQFVLNQITNFGFMTKEQEQAGLCGDLTSYPNQGAIPEGELTLADYDRVSIDLSGSVGWSVVMDEYQALFDETDRDQVLNSVKDALNNGDRLTLGVLLFSTSSGVVGAVGQHHVANDTWVVTPLIKAAINAHEDHGGHEMIITGYDDDAIATDAQGRIYRGLLTLRNSWGSHIGDAGDFYMSYDYFKRLAHEVQRIRLL